MHEQAGRHAFLFHRARARLPSTLPRLHSSMNAASFGSLRGRAGRERMLGGDRHEGHAHQRVGARGEHLRARFALAVRARTGNAISHAFAAADPVRLHRLHALGPAGRSSSAASSSSAYCGDAQEVHRDLALLDQRAGAPAAAVDHLLVGEHGLVDRIPVDDAGLLVGDAASRACAGTATGSSGSSRAGRSRARGSSRCAKPSDCSCRFM